MKKQLSVLVSSALLGMVSQAAMADVQLYGNVDVGVAKTSTSEVSTTKIDSNGSYIGLKGAENLSGDTSAVWQFEQGVRFDGDKAQGSFTDNMRDTFIGLSSNSLGTVKLGKNTTPYHNVGGELDVFKDQLGSSKATFGRFNQRLPNSIVYQTPVWGGFSASAGYGSGELTKFAGEKAVKSDVYSTGLNYNWNGKLNTGIGYERHNAVNGEKDKFYGIKASGSWLFDNNAMIGTGYERVTYDAKHDFGVKTKQDSVTVTGLYPVGNFDIKGNYGRLFDFKGEKKTGANFYNAGVDYRLSKRTKLGTYYSYIDNDKYASYNFYNNPLTVDGESAVSSGKNVSSFGANISHKF